MADLRGILARARKELRTVGIDITGEGAPVPPGNMRVFEYTADAYRAAGHQVRQATIEVNGEQKAVTLVQFGDPKEVAARVMAGEFYPKPNEG